MLLIAKVNIHRPTIAVILKFLIFVKCHTFIYLAANRGHPTGHAQTLMVGKTRIGW